MSIDPRYQQAYVDGTSIRIGKQKYDYVVGGKVVTDKKELKKVVKLMNQHLNESEVQQAAANKESFNIYKSSVQLLSNKQPIAFKEEAREHYVEKAQSLKARYAQKEALQRGLLALEATYDKSTIQQALANLLTKPNVTIHHPEISERFGHSMTLSDILQEPGNESAFDLLFTKLQKPLLPLESEQITKCEQDLNILILSNLQNNPTTLGKTFLQKFSKGTQEISGDPKSHANSRLDPETFRQANRAYPNIIDKGKRREQKEVQQHNINLGSVSAFDPSGKSVVVINRSGRSDTPQRLFEAVEDALLNEIDTTIRRGLNETGQKDSSGRPIYEFTHAIDSHLDLSLAKRVATSENERESMLAMMRARDAWPEKGIYVKVAIDGKEHTVILKRPIVRNHILSGLAAIKKPEHLPKFMRNFVDSKRDSHRLNFVSNQQLFSRYLATCIGSDTSELEQKSRALAAKLKLGNEPLDFEKLSSLELFNQGTAFFSSKEFTEYQAAVAKFLLEEMKKSSDITPFALYSMLFQRQLPSPGRIKSERIEQALTSWKEAKQELVPPDDIALSASDIQIYTNLAIENLNLSKGNQCKSGKDRTSLAVAYATAQVNFRIKHGYDFIPDQGFRQDPNDLKNFREYFLEALFTFGMPTTLKSTGEWGLKLGDGIGNPVLLQYLPDAYVENRNEAKAYSGRLKEPAKILGLTDRKWRKEVENHAQQHFTGAVAQEAKQKLTLFFQKDLQLPDVKVPLFSDNFELVVSLSRLALGENRRFERIKEKIAEMERNEEQHVLELHALKMVVRLYERRKEIKEALRATEYQPRTPSDPPVSRHVLPHERVARAREQRKNSTSQFTT